MSFFSRHPRFTIALITILFISTIFLFNNPISHRSSFTSYSFLPSLRDYKTIDIVRQTEVDYQKKVIQERRKLIRKYGPLPSQVEAWPSTWEYYTLWDFFIPGFQCPHRAARVGTLGDGGKWVCGLERLQHKKNCVIYSFGINGESSFEAEILRRVPGCQLWGYDFSVGGFGPELAPMSLSSRAHFQPWALGAVDNHGPNADPKVWTLRRLMETNGHDFIDILKIDIEGAEFASLTPFFDFYESQPAPTSPADSPMDFHPSPGDSHGSSTDVIFPGKPLPIGQMQIEIHPREHDELSKDFSTFPTFLAFWEKMERLGLRPFWTEPNLVYVHLLHAKRPDLSEYSFINIRGRHELLIDELVEEGPASDEDDEWA